MRNIDFLVNNNEFNCVCFCKLAEMRGMIGCKIRAVMIA